MPDLLVNPNQPMELDHSNLAKSIRAHINNPSYSRQTIIQNVTADLMERQLSTPQACQDVVAADMFKDDILPYLKTIRDDQIDPFESILHFIFNFSYMSFDEAQFAEVAAFILDSFHCIELD